MDFQMDEIAAKRAEKSRDSKLWTARDALLDLVGPIDNGLDTDCHAIPYVENVPNSTSIRYSSGLSHDQHISLLEMAKFNVIRDYFNG